MKKLNTLNEEINRMKSLFGESRLYGNLVTEDTEPSPDKVKEVMEPIKKETLKILSLWKSYNNGLSGLSIRVVGKGKIKEEIEKAESIISGMDSKDFCSDATLSKIESKRRELEEVEKEYENILTDKDKGFISRLKGKMNLLKDECKRLKTETSTEEVIDGDEKINAEVSNDEEEGGEGDDVTQEEPKEEKTTTKVIPTELMDCDEVEMGDDSNDEGYTGLFKSCENGKAISVTEKKDGKDHGLYRRWGTNGKLEVEWNYKNGKLDGISKSWYGDGVRSEVYYKDGKKHGISKLWYSDGKLSDIEYYINNNKVSKEEYLKTSFPDVDAEFDDDITSGEKDNIEVKNVDKKPTDSGDIIGVNYRTGKKTIDGVLKKVKDKDGETTFIIKNRKVPILNPRRNGFIDDDAKRGVMDALKNIGIDTTNKTINVINDRKFTIK